MVTWKFSFIALALVACWCACSGPLTSQQIASEVRSYTATDASLDSLYARAIGDYLSKVQGRYRLDFDTLVFFKRANGQPDDFPDIRLPSRIGDSRILLVPQPSGEEMQRQSPNLVTINMMGWIDAASAEFLLVTFSERGVHQFDCQLNYAYDRDDRAWSLRKTDWKEYRYAK